GEAGLFRRNLEKVPACVERAAILKKGCIVQHPVVNDARDLRWLANQDCITPHVWTSRVPDLFHPDVCVFDLDPLEDDADALRAACFVLRDLLAELGCESWVKTTGSKGLHIVITLDGSADWREVTLSSPEYGWQRVEPVS